MVNQDKNRQNHEKQEAVLEKQHHQETEKAELKTMTGEQLRQQLSNKNAAYLFRLEKYLRETAQLTAQEAQQKVDPLLPEIIEAQHKGIPVVNLYHASAQIKADQLLHPQAKPTAVKFWMRASDNALLYLVMFTGLLGVLALFSNQKTQTQTQMGIVTVFSVGILFGILMTYYNDLIMKKATQRPKIWQFILIGVAMVAAIFFWIMLTSLPALRFLNPVIPGWAELVIAILAYLGRHFLRAHYGITDANQPDGQRHPRA